MTDAVDILVDSLGGLDARRRARARLRPRRAGRRGRRRDPHPLCRAARLPEERRHRPCRRGRRRRLRRRPVLMLAGRAHYYEHGDAAVMRPALEALAGIGIDKLILTNAAGSLEPDMPPGSVMLITDHINFSGSNPLFGEPTDRRFVGLTEAYDAGIRAAIEKAAAGDRHAAAQGRLHVVLRPVLRDAGRDPHGARHGRRRRRHVDRAGSDPRPLPRPARRRLLGHHQPRRRHDRRRTVAPGDQGHGAARRRAAARRSCKHASAARVPHGLASTSTMLPQEIIRKKRDGKRALRRRDRRTSSPASLAARSPRARSPRSPWRSSSTA